MRVVAAGDPSSLAGLLDGGWSVPDAVRAEVAGILAAVEARGDTAVLEYARRFDDTPLGTSLRVAIPMLDNVRSRVSPEIARALDLERERLTRFHQRQRLPDISYVEEDGSRYAVARRPLQSVAVYAPRSGALSAILMGAVPAKVAGVARVAVLSPPGADGFDTALLLACVLCGVDELYAVGGAQAIAAAAFGTQSLRAVDKIVGRGGTWTTEAKRQVYGRCGIDGLNGPPEALIVADDAASSEYVVGELLAVSERPGVARAAVISESRSLLEAVAQLIDTLDLEPAERRDVVRQAILTNARLVAVKSREELFSLINRFAPAYLCLQVRDAWSYLDRITTAGTILIGDSTPLVSGEYLAGTNAIAPAGGTARFASCLSLADFTRSFSAVENSAERLVADAGVLAALAERDGFPHHAQTARMRQDR